MASVGHVRDLPKSRFGIDLEDNYTPSYITIRGKGKLIQQLKSAAKKANQVLLATDPDREGEAISWHLAHLLGLDPTTLCRVTFHEITAKAVTEAFQHPRGVDLDYVDAYQARRILDRIFGYQLSPFLWRKLRYGLSAGRVQSVALKLICERELEVQNFVPQEYWSLELELSGGGGTLKGRLQAVDGAKPSLNSREEVEALIASMPSKLTVCAVRRNERVRTPPPPYITSTLQQEAASRLAFPVRKTMQLAQQLYEGVELGDEGMVGLITYMRTDSTNISQEAFQEAQSYLRQKYGADYTIDQKRTYPGRKTAQEAHEAIRPTSSWREPEVVKPFLSRDLQRLYKLIYERFLAAQCASALIDTLTAELPHHEKLVRINASKVRFKGFLALSTPESSEEEKEEEDNSFLPDLARGEELQITKWLPKQHFTQAAPRFSEALLVKTMEELGIGRPSTYASTADTLLRRGYILSEEKRFYPTKLGLAVNQLLVDHFQTVVESAYTAQIEDALDKVEAGTETWQEVVDFFYQPFSQLVATAEAEVEAVTIPDELVDAYCPECGGQLVIKRGRFGSFHACSAWPKCSFTKSIALDTGVVCPACANGTLLERKARRGNRNFYGCSAFPECNFVSWEKPVSRLCPECGSSAMSQRLMKRQGGVRFRCLREGCGFEEIVIGATLEEEEAPETGLL